MKHLRLFMEFGADAVTAELAHDRTASSLCLLLNGMTNVAEMCAGLYPHNAQPKAFEGEFAEPSCLN
ncbi:MAG: hypothetical protein AW12_02768 [Candidatus Accumulibacter sp. BA-94]|nr:MAG: hypothetical protein AW12_02768 [Candidatus Accumulibacter sp. BA-94]